MWSQDDVFTTCEVCKHLRRDHYNGNHSVRCKAFTGTKLCGCDQFVDSSKIRH